MHFTVGQAVSAVFAFTDVVEHIEHGAYSVRVTGQFDNFLQTDRFEYTRSFHRRYTTVCTILRTLYEVINLSTASAPEANRFLAVVRYWVLSLTPPSAESLSSKNHKPY